VPGRLGLMVGKSGVTDIPVTPLGTKEVRAATAHHPAPLGRVLLLSASVPSRI
jgi:hypothetical protein